MESDTAENNNTMATNVQTPYTTRSSAAIALTDSNEYVLAFHGDGIHCHLYQIEFGSAHDLSNLL